MISVIFPTHGKSFLTKRCLQSLRKQTFSNLDASQHIKVIVVDNKSPDDTVAMIQKDFPEVIVLEQIDNLGFAKACNIGMKHALRLYPDCDILITNNDVEFTETCLDELGKFAYSDTSYGIVGGKLFLPNGNIQHAGAYLNGYGWGQHIGGGQPDGMQLNVEKEMEYVTGALFFIRSDAQKDVGFFDEKFSPAYFEEVDYCYRARDLGYKVMYSPKAVATHYENSTGKDMYGEALQATLSHVNQVRFWSDFDKYKYPTAMNPATPRVMFTGKMYGLWSFSIELRNLAEALEKNGIDVCLAPEEYHSFSSMPDWEAKRLIQKPHDYWNRIVIRASEGDHSYLMPPGKYRIVWTTNESTKLHREWVEQLNHVDEVWAMSTFFRDILLKHGVTTPIHVIPCSVDTTIFNPKAEPSMQNEHPDTYVFLSVLSNGDRKGLDVLLRAYGAEFNKTENVCLVIHSHSFQQYLQSLNRTLDEYVTQYTGLDHANIIFSLNAVDPMPMAGLYTSSNCFVLATRAEGFGIPFLEAAACGIPSIATDYSGHKDFINETNGLMIDYKMVDIPLQVVPYFRNYCGGQWAEPSVESLRKQMRYAFDHRKEMIEKGRLAFEASKVYSTESVGLMVANRLREINAGLNSSAT